MFGPVVPYTGTYTVVYVLKEVPGFLGVDGNYYGPYKRGDVVSLPEEDVAQLIGKGLASYSPPVYSYVTVYAKATIPAFTGVDGKIYGPFKEGDAVLIPKEDAERLVGEGVATYTPVEISRAISDLLERVSRVETDIENVRTDLATLSESVNNLAKSIDTLSGQIPGILTTVTGIGAVTIILLIIAIIMTLRKK